MNDDSGFLAWARYQFRFKFYMSLLNLINKLVFPAILLICVLGYLGYRYVTKPAAPQPRASVVALDKRPSDAFQTLLYYSPTSNLEQIEADDLSRIRGHLDIAMYSFTSVRLAHTLLRLAQQGTDIRIYRDAEQFNNEQQRQYSTTRLMSGNPHIHIRVKTADGSLMHMKAYSDGVILSDGSVNWSIDGLTRQDNQLRYTNDRNEIRQFEAQFNRMWMRSDNQIVQR